MFLDDGVFAFEERLLQRNATDILPVPGGRRGLCVRALPMRLEGMWLIMNKGVDFAKQPPPNDFSFRA